MLYGIDTSLRDGRFQVVDAIVGEPHDARHARRCIHRDLLETEPGGQPQLGDDRHIDHAVAPLVLGRQRYSAVMSSVWRALPAKRVSVFQTWSRNPSARATFIKPRRRSSPNSSSPRNTSVSP